MTPVEKKAGAETTAYHRLQKLLRDYLVGIDIGTIEWRDQAGEIFERLHFPVILFCLPCLLPRPLAHVDEMARDGRCRRHYWAHQVGSPALALPPLEVAVRRARASLARLQHVGVHRDTHAASRLAPFETGLRENLIEPELLCLLLDQLRSRHDHRLHRRRNLAALDDLRRRLQIGYAGIGA